MTDLTQVLNSQLTTHITAHHSLSAHRSTPQSVMPLLSRRRRAVAAMSRSRSCKFQSKAGKVTDFVDDLQDEYFDLDDDRLENFRDAGEDVEIDYLEDAANEIIPTPSRDFVSKVKSWREDGNNSGVRGAGTSYRTFKRNKRKLKDTQSAAKTCKSITGFLVPVVNHATQSASVVSAPDEIEPTPNEDTPFPNEIVSVPDGITPSDIINEDAIDDKFMDDNAIDDNVIDDDVIDDNVVDDNVINGDDIFGILDAYNMFGDEEIGEPAVKIPKFTMKEAIANLLVAEAKVTRNKKDEKKSLLQAYQRVQRLALLRYFQLILDGNLKMKASAEVALCLYQKEGIWSYKARSIRS